MIELVEKYDWILKILLSAGMVFFIAWSARRSKTIEKNGWKYLSHPFALKLLALVFLIFMVAALIHNGFGLFQEKWWVVIGFLATVAMSVYLFYVTYGISIRWNNVEIQKTTFFLKTVAFQWNDTQEFHLLQGGQRLEMINSDGRNLKMDLSNRAGVQELISDINGVLSARKNF